MAATFAVTASVLAPAGMVLGQSAPAGASTATVVIAVPEPDAAALLLPAVQKVREAAAR